MAMHPSAKRPRLAADASARTMLVGDDSALPDEDRAKYEEEVCRLTAAGQQFVDEDFPATQLSIKGKDEVPLSDAPPPPPPREPGAPPTCRCGAAAAAAIVSKDTPNKGRRYWHCPFRRCSFFAWADGGEVAFRGGGSAAKLTWARLPPELGIVSDYGFRAEDLRQGGVGDCWFMSALAVVAERHDLIARLFAADTARNAAGLCCVRLFLDGAWSSVWIDDQLPVTSQPRREALAFDTKLAFCRCSSVTGAQQLWASFVEKAYAKAHGSFQAISGGQVAEALLDLTGAPTEMIYLGDDRFDSELMWARLRAYRALELPMGCGTNNAEGQQNLREVGLVGGHAYSILDVREATTRTGERVRLLRVRNPHGCTEWNGEWSDSSDLWSQLVGSDGGGAGGAAGPGFERTGVDDGTFWIDYTKFMMGFSHVDVCYAFRGWHARSYPNHFPPDRKTSKRLCASVLTIRVHERPTTLMVMALQPTKRGSWCRADRKKSYRLGDLSVLVGRLTADGTRLAQLVGGGLRGADRGERTWVATLDAHATYVVLPLCLSNNPTAAETTARQPFTVRLWASERVHIDSISSYPPHEAAPRLQLDWCAQLALQALHMAMAGALVAVVARPIVRSFGCTAELEQLLMLPQNASLLMDGGSGARVSTRLHRISQTAAALVVTGDELTLIAGYNWAPPSAPALMLRATAFVKSCAARGVEGPLTNLKDEADAYYRRRQVEKERLRAAEAARGVPPPPPRGERGVRWPAKWSAYCTSARVPPQSRRLLMVAAASGMQYELGEIEIVSVRDGEQGASATVAAGAALTTAAAADEDEAVAPGPLPAAVAVDDASTEEDEPTPTPTANVPLKEVREARLRHFVA